MDASLYSYRKVSYALVVIALMAAGCGAPKTESAPKPSRRFPGTEQEVRAAEEAIAKILSPGGQAQVASDLSSSTLDCGPGIWKEIENLASDELRKSRNFVVGESKTKPGTRLVRHALKSQAELLEFWGLMLAKYSGRHLKVRKVSESDLEYYFATTPQYDFEGPLVAAEVDDSTVLLFGFVNDPSGLRIIRVDRADNKL